MGGIWIGEADGFTEFLRPEECPDELGSIEVDLSALPKHIGVAILDAIHLPLRHGMSFEQVTLHIGSPEAEGAFAVDRTTYYFTVGSRFRYYVSCAIHEAEGLIHVTVIRTDLLSKVDTLQQ